MLAVPFLVGVACSRPVWVDVPLLVAWLAGYLLSYYALLAVKTGRPGRVAAPLRLYAALCVPAAALVATARPAVWAFAPAFAVLLAVNAWYARRRADRALVNDLVSVAESCLMVPLAAVVAGRSAGGVVLPAAVVFCYFAGSVLYVKTMIRNRGERGYLVASVAVHLVLAAAVAAASWPLGVLFCWLAVRAAWWPWLPAGRMTPMRVGLIEGVHCLALLVAVPLLLAPR
jgi:YwiC-like protein